MIKRVIFTFLMIMAFTNMFAQSGRISVHDPVMIKQDSIYYLFCTGNGISVFSSPDMKEWKSEAPVFEAPPAWAVEAVPTYRGHTWAPDIAFYNGQYYLYYSVSAFGKNTSAIGVATNKTLHPESSDFKWVDHGKVIQSYPGVTNWNAIDPNLITDDKGNPYLTWGSFWDGLQIIRLSSDALSVADDITKISTVVSRKSNSGLTNSTSIDKIPIEAGSNAVEAPFIFKKANYYYMFASIDYCCRGENSTYKMIVGRSENVNGPFIDKEKKNMALGGGTILLQGDENWHGVGHNAVVSFDGTDYILFHAYDANDRGRSKLRIFKLTWDKKDWPVLGESVY